jgi:hypothetical protein
MLFAAIRNTVRLSGSENLAICTTMGVDQKLVTEILEQLADDVTAEIKPARNMVKPVRFYDPESA